MATVKVVDVLSRCKTILHDVLKVRWPDEELLDWFNAGQVVIATIRPDSSTERADYECVLGTEQSLPEDAFRLVRVVRNVGGGSIRFIGMDELDDLVPDWHDDSSPVTDCEMYTYLDKDPLRFYLYPAPAAGHSVSIIYSKSPASVELSDSETDTTVIGLPDNYADPLVDYILYRAFSKDSDHSNGDRATYHYRAMMTGIQGKSEADAGMSPANG